MGPSYQTISNDEVDQCRQKSVLDSAPRTVTAEQNGSFLFYQFQKRPMMVLGTTFVIALVLGHSIPATSHSRNHDPINLIASGSSSSSIRSSITSDVSEAKRLKHKAQSFADEQTKIELQMPSLESEMYYNPTKEEKEYPLMGKGIDKPKPPPHDGCEGTAIVIRHCEKGDIREHCNPIGFERAQYISTLFGNADERWPAPSFIYALSPGQRKNDEVENMREIETVTPLSKKLNVTIDSSFGLDNKEDFAKHIFHSLRSGELCGKIALISWKHQDIPHLAHSLGCGPDQGCPIDFDSKDFDSSWQIKYSYHKEQFSPYPAAEDKKKKHKNWGKHPKWWIFGDIEKEGFDPLAFSKERGSYGP